MHLTSHVQTIIRHAYYDGIHHLLCMSIILFVIAAILCWFLIKKEPKKDINEKH